MEKSVKRIIIVVALILVAAGGGLLWQYFQAPALPADIASGNGRIEAVQVDIATKIAGRVESVVAQEGDLVTEGQVVATIDTAQLKAQLLRAEAVIASYNGLSRLSARGRPRRRCRPVPPCR